MSLHYVSLGDFRCRVTWEWRENLLEILSLVPFWHQRKILKNEGAGQPVSLWEGKRTRVGRNSFNWKSEETRRRGRDTMWTRRLEREDRGRGGAERRADSGGSSTLALVLRPMWNLVPYTLVLHTFSHVRRYKHVRTGPSAMKLRGRYIIYQIYHFLIYFFLITPQYYMLKRYL